MNTLIDLKKWQDVLRWDEQHIEELRVLGYLYIRQGHFKIAQHFFEILAIITSQKHIDEQSAYDFQTLGSIYLETGDHERALRYLERALRLDPTNDTTRINRMKALFLLGNLHQAHKEAKTFKRCPNEKLRNEAEAYMLAYPQKTTA